MKYLISDTREKKNQHVLDYFETVGIKYEIAKLDFGDYMDAYRPGIVIDRKQNIAELAKNVVGKDRDRFVRELERALPDLDWSYWSSRIDTRTVTNGSRSKNR